MILEKHFFRSSGEQIHTSSSPPHDPFRLILENIVPRLIAKIAMKITNSVIRNKFIAVKITH